MNARQRQAMEYLREHGPTTLSQLAKALHSCEDELRFDDWTTTDREEGSRWQCTCGIVHELHDGKWVAMFMAPESLRRKGTK